MITRVTNQTMMQSAQRNLQTNLARMAELQDKASGQKAFTRASDDPSAAAESLRVRAELRAVDQYSRNIADGDAWLTAVDSSLTAASATLNKVRDLTVQGGNGSLSASGREALAIEVSALREQLLAQTNTKHQGRTIFAGNSDTGVAFTDTLDHTGGTGDERGVMRRVDANVTVRVDVDGAAVFGTGDASVFRLLDNIAVELKLGTDVSGHLGALDTRLAAVRTHHAEVGTRHAQILNSQEVNMETSVSLEAQRSRVEDVDLAAVILEMKLQEVTYQSALAVTARVLQPTLMDFLR
ncbi:flagellar hook-associated protein FlgL [Arthrobacter sp. H20]|uniref:flagellar hook-associated protein FlgL n=1 Tax=Arthrobacter sp. H20 TaxID=1267981 RepID=UPI00047E4A85|nr:flagellar hook-associated protein FlgL [Arthrobacter sp. H20]